MKDISDKLEIATVINVESMNHCKPVCNTKREKKYLSTSYILFLRIELTIIKENLLTLSFEIKLE